MAKEYANIEDEFRDKFAVSLFNWQHVEWELFFLFEIIVWAKDRRMNSAVWHSVVNINARITMLDECADIAFKNDPLLKEWETLSNRIRKRARKRNDLVHLMPLAQAGKDGKTEIKFVTNVWDKREGQDRSYGVKEIEEITASFDKLSWDLSEFSKKAGALLFPPSP